MESLSSPVNLLDSRARQTCSSCTDWVSVETELLMLLRFLGVCSADRCVGEAAATDDDVERFVRDPKACSA